VISIAVVGARGFVGTAIRNALENTRGVEPVSVYRDNYADARARRYEVLINCAMPSGRFWAKNHPSADFVETVQKTAELFYNWNFKKFVQISSVSARCQLDTVYGRHKAAAEQICAMPQSLIVRLGPMYGPTLSKGVLIDMLHGRAVFVAGESRYCFTPLHFVASWIAKNYDRSGLVEVGARDAVALHEVARYLRKDIEFRGDEDHQEVIHPEPDYPSAREVLPFLDEYRGAHALL
jgi:nucleoside-diphosphate-sugar epimerase